MPSHRIGAGLARDPAAADEFLPRHWKTWEFHGGYTGTDYDADAEVGFNKSGTGTYRAAGNRNHAWNAVSKNLDWLMQNDKTTKWLTPTGGSIKFNEEYYGTDREQKQRFINHFFGTGKYEHGNNARYQVCLGLIQTAFAGITGRTDASARGAGTELPWADATGTAESMETSGGGGTYAPGMESLGGATTVTFAAGARGGAPEAFDDQKLLQLMGGDSNAAKYAKILYDAVLKCKDKADALWGAGAPPEGSDEYKNAKKGSDVAGAIAAALKALEPPEVEEVTSTAKADKRPKSIGFKEQCFVLSKIVALADHRGQVIDKREAKPIPYQGSFMFNSSIMCMGEPFSFINRLAVYETQEQFLTMPSAEIANLQPMIRFFKIQQDPQGTEVPTEIHFGTTPGPGEIEELVQSQQRKRGYGVGIESFNVKLIGTSVFAAKMDMEASLTIFANSFADLLKPRGTTPHRYRYIDLALHTTNAKMAAERFNEMTGPNAHQVVENLDDLTFKIRAVVGTQVPPGSVSAVDEGGALKGAIQTNKMTLEMTPTDHEFNFNEDGTLRFVIHYKPYQNQHYSGLTYDIFNDPKNNAFRLLSKLQEEYLSSQCDPKALKEFREKQIPKIAEHRARSVQSIVQNMHIYGKMRYIFLPDEILDQINREGANFKLSALDDARLKIETPSGLKQLENALLVQAKSGKAPRSNSGQERVGVVAMSDTQNELVYFYLSDLIDIIMLGTDRRLNPTNFAARLKAVEEAAPVLDDPALTQRQKELNKQEYNNWKRLRVVLGPIELVDPLNPARVKIFNLGDLPISLKYFMEFMTAETLQKNLFTFSLDSFLDKLINKMLSSFLNDDTCFNGSVKQKTTLKRTSIHATSRYATNKDPQAAPPTDDLSRWISEQRSAWYEKQTTSGAKTTEKHTVSRLYPEWGAPSEKSPLLQVSPSVQTSISPTYDSYNYLVFYTARNQPLQLYTGDREADAKRGVHHYATGRDRGIIKKITLNRDERPHQRETRFEMEGYDGLRQLRHTYNVEVNTYANFGVYCGQTIYLDPQGWVPYLDPETSDHLGGIKGLTDLGVGGYYDVYDAEHSFGPGTFESTFHAVWTAQVSRETLQPRAEAPPAPDTAAGAKAAGKCKVAPAPDDPVQDASVQIDNAKPAEARRAAYAESQVPPGAQLNKDGQIATHPSPDRNPDPAEGWDLDAAISYVEAIISDVAADLDSGPWSGEMDPPPPPAEPPPPPAAPKTYKPWKGEGGGYVHISQPDHPGHEDPGHVHGAGAGALRLEDFIK